MLMLYLLALVFEYVVANETPEIVPEAFGLNDEATECLDEVLNCNRYRTLLTVPLLNIFYEEHIDLRMLCQVLRRYRTCLNSYNVNRKCANMGELNAFIKKIIRTRLFPELLCGKGSLWRYLYLRNARCINYFIERIKRMCRSMSSYDHTDKLNNLDTMCRDRKFMQNCEMARLQETCGRDAVIIYYNVIKFNQQTDFICYRISPEFLNLKNNSENDFKKSLTRDQICNKTLVSNSSGRSKISEENSDDCDEWPLTQYTEDLNTDERPGQQADERPGQQADERPGQQADEIRRRGDSVEYCAERNKKAFKNELKNKLNRDACGEIFNRLLRLEKDQKDFFKQVQVTVDSYLKVLVRLAQTNSL